jgi:hypothetical protein
MARHRDWLTVLSVTSYIQLPIISLLSRKEKDIWTCITLLGYIIWSPKSSTLNDALPLLQLTGMGIIPGHFLTFIQFLGTN